MGKPKRQFARPSIEITDRVRRVWCNVSAKSLQVEDVVSGCGMAMRLGREVRDGRDVVVLENAVGKKYYLNPEAVVFAYTREASG